MKFDPELLYWVLRGRQRRTVIMALDHGEMTLNGISERTKQFGKMIAPAKVKAVLEKLADTNILTYKDTAEGRLYSLTQKGKKYWKRVSRSPLLQISTNHQHEASVVEERSEESSKPAEKYLR